MLSKQTMKSELKQLVDKLTWKLKEGKEWVNHVVEAEREKALGKAKQAE